MGATDKGGLMFDLLTGTNTVLNEIIFNTELGSDVKGVRVDSTAANLTLAGDLTASLADAAFSGNGDFIISGSIKGPFGLEIGGIDSTTRTVTLSASSNPYNGDTTILKGVLSVSSIGSQLGTAGTPIAMGATGAEVGTARLRYTGTGETTARGVVTSGALANTAAIEQAGSGLLKFTGPFSVATGNNRTLILDGSTAGTGEISGVISNNSAALRTQVTKNGSGTWTLSGLNTYSNNTTVNAGTLILASTGQLTFRTGDTSGTGNNVLSGAGTITLNGSFVIDTSVTDASALTSGSWLIENSASLPAAYGATFTVVGWTDAGSDKWTKNVGSKNYVFDETTGTVSLSLADPYLAWIESFTPNILLPDAASKLPEADPDVDGITNLMEFVLAGSPVVSSQAVLPTQAIVGPDVVLSYKRSDASEAPATIQTGQWSTDLSVWNGVTPVLVNENGSAPDDMTITVATSNAVAGKLFLRLKAVK
jgi:autotransporter-associated beta strand protein